MIINKKSLNEHGCVPGFILQFLTQTQLLKHKKNFTFDYKAICLLLVGLRRSE